MDVAMERDDEVRDAYRLYHDERDGTAHVVSGAVLAMRLVGADVEVGEVPVAVPRVEGRGEAEP